MKKFWKENSKHVWKMIVYQLAMIILGATTAFATSSNPTWFVITSAFSSFFYLFLIGTVSYLEGREDGIRIEAKKMKFRPFRFLAVSALANALAIVLGILMLIFSRIGSMQSAAQALRLIDGGILHIMYRGLAKTLTSDGYVISALMPAPALIVTTVSYLLGIKFKNGLKKSGQETGIGRYTEKN